MFSEETEFECKSYLLFLENYDGPSFNALMKDLCLYYVRAHEQQFSFMPNAIARAIAFCGLHYSHYWARYAKNKDSFVRDRVEICAYVATELVLYAKREFEIGNVY